MTGQLSRVSVLVLAASVCASGQSARRWAVLAAHGPAATANPAIAVSEARIADELTSRLTGSPGLILIDRASVDKVLTEQNFQNSDRSSASTAARIGKLLGVGQIVLLQVYDASYTTHQEESGLTTSILGTVVLRASARVVDVETDVIQAQPSATFEDSVTVSKTSKTQGFHYGALQIPAKQKTSGGDPKVIEDDEWAKADDAVVKDLAAKLTTGMPTGPSASTVASSPMAVAEGPMPMVAGVASGSVYINQGSAAGIKTGDRFQIMREVSLGFNDPQTGKPMTKKQPVCVLTIASAEESNAFGSCAGGVPQAKDTARPLR